MKQIPSTGQPSSSRQRNVRQMKKQIPNGYGVYISPNTGNTYMRVSYFNYKEPFTTSLYMIVDGYYFKLMPKLMVKQALGQGRPVQLNTPSQPLVTQVRSQMITQASTNASKTPHRE